MTDIKRGDGLVLVSGSRYIVEGEPFNRGNELFDDWRVAAWDEGTKYRFPIQLIAIVAVYRAGIRIDNIETEVQMTLWE